MNRLLFFAIISLISFLNFNCKQTKSPEPHGPLPSKNQLRWQEMEYYAFIHFSLNTYTDQSWGYGNEDINLFNPTNLDCRQWARICKEAGMKGIIITAKHHCGFCLWPTETTEYSVKNSPWKDGKGDVIKEMADACKEYGLKLGIYVSPWDRNHPEYGKPEYIHVFRNQNREVLTNYGDIFEIWFDGANGGTGYYDGANENRQIDRTVYYDWQPTYKMIRELQPNIVIWNDGGDRADLRWVGTEEGFVGETNWSLLNDTGEVEWGMLHFGLETGNAWVPAEVNTSIRPEWFYHPNEDDKVKTLPHLMNIYYHSIGHNATLLLNFPIMPNGLIHHKDEKAALDFAKTVRESFAVNLAEKANAEATNVRGNAKRFSGAKAIDGNKETYWATDDSVTKASFTIEFDKPVMFNRYMAQEYIRLGQRVKSFTIDAYINADWKEIAKGTTIGYKRIVRFPSVNASKVRINITGSKSCPLISNIGVYNAPLILDAPVILRNQAGEVSIYSNDIGPHFYYTLDGSEPTPKSARYTGPILTKGKVNVKAIAYDPASGKSSPVKLEKFDICRKDWKIPGFADENTRFIIDGNPATVWHQRDKKMPIDIVIELGNKYNISGFKYLPDQNRWSSGIISNYEFFVSDDNINWKKVDQGEFSNIKNNPVWQIKSFRPVNARYIRLRALSNVWGDDIAGYAEIDIITN
ncbi:MAG: alpha-L-fucosidase [Bacteroidales bacterium]|nr:alpha-L-fucosidase [Bacteroidales bacterium]